MANILIVYGTREGQTAKVAEHIAGIARKQGLVAQVADAKDLPDPAAVDAVDAVLVGASVQKGLFAPAILDWVGNHRSLLERVPSAFFTVSLTSSTLEVAESRKNAEEYVSSFVQLTGWQPTKVGLFAGALRYTQYDDPTRDLLVSVAARTGKPTDISRDHEFTDWNAVARFTHAVLSGVPVRAQ